MKTTTFQLAGALLLAVLVAAPNAGRAASDEARELMWDDLMPKNWTPFNPYADIPQEELDALTDSSARAQLLMQKYAEAMSSAPVVTELDGERVRLPGFIVPLDFEGTEVSEFLLVPYFGACIHVPPPPSNQIVFVKAERAYSLKQIFDPVWVTGTLSTQAFLNDVGDAGYTMQATEVEPYE